MTAHFFHTAESQQGRIFLWESKKHPCGFSISAILKPPVSSEIVAYNTNKCYHERKYFFKPYKIRVLRKD